MTRLFDEPRDSVVLFMIRGNNVFPVVVAKSTKTGPLQDAKRLERQMRCTFSGRLMSVGEWNDNERDGIDSVANVVADLTSETIITE